LYPVVVAVVADPPMRRVMVAVPVVAVVFPRNRAEPVTPALAMRAARAEQPWVNTQVAGVALVQQASRPPEQCREMVARALRHPLPDQALQGPVGAVVEPVALVQREPAARAAVEMDPRPVLVQQAALTPVEAAADHDQDLTLAPEVPASSLSCSDRGKDGTFCPH
jgi:outer membrane translocation and assembly module TamA